MKKDRMKEGEHEGEEGEYTHVKEVDVTTKKKYRKKLQFFFL